LIRRSLWNLAAGFYERYSIGDTASARGVTPGSIEFLLANGKDEFISAIHAGKALPEASLR
jgi:hypothetical protein